MRVSDIVRAIQPYVLGWISETGGGDGPYAPTPHDLNSAHHSGQVADSQAPQFLKTDGSRDLTNDLGVAANVTIDGVDVSAFKASYDTHVGTVAATAHGGVGAHDHQTTLNGGQLTHNAALTGIGANDHHAAFVGLEDNAGMVVSPAADNRIRFTDDGKVNVDASGVALDLSLDEGQVNHDALLNFDLDEHVAHSDVTLTAGAGLTGGGDITASRSFAVGAGDGIDVTANAVAVDVTDVIDTAYGLTEDSNNIRVDLDGSGGLEFNGGAVRVKLPTNHGLSRTSGGLALGTPADVSVSSANGVTSATHAHNVVTSSNPTGASILASDANGRLQLKGVGIGVTPVGQELRLDGDLVFVGAQSITTTAGALTLAPAGGTTEVTGALDVSGGGAFGGAVDITNGDLTVLDGGTTVLKVDVSGHRIGVMTNNPDPQFAMDVAGPLRAQYLIGPHALQFDDVTMICHFDGSYPVETDYTVDTRGHLGQVPAVQNGGVIGRPGRFGKAVQIGAATTNLIDNPSFETSAWSRTWLNATRTTELSRYGDYAAKLEYSGGNATIGTNVNVDSGTTYTVTGYVYVTSGTLHMDLRDKAYETEQYQGETGGEWVRMTMTFTPDATETIQVRFFFSSAGTGYVDGVQLEANAYATPYCDGSLGDGHSWSGTAHASTSTRTGASLRWTLDSLGISDEESWTVFVWAKPGPKVVSGHSGREVILEVGDYYDSGEANILWGHGWGGDSDNQYAYTFRSYVDQSVMHSTTTLSSADASDWCLFAIRYDASAGHCYGDIYAVATSTHYSIDYSWTLTGLSDSTYLTLGGYDWDPTNGNTVFDDLAVFNRMLEDEELLAVFESDAPIFAETSIQAWRSPAQVPIWVDEEGLWGRDEDGNAAIGWSSVSSKSWGGKTLDAGDFLLGHDSEYMWWDASAETVDISGGVTAARGQIGGWAITATELHNDDLWLDAAAKQIAVGSQTWGNDGIQLEYNGGNPRAFIGDASEFIAFDGSALKWQASNTVLDGSSVWVGDSSSTERISWDATNGLRIYDANNAPVLEASPSGSVWLSNLAISESMGAQLFTTNDGLFLLNSDCPITTNSWTSLRGQAVAVSGAFRQVAGRFPGTRALQVSIAHTNYCTNPVMYDSNSDGKAWGLNTGGSPTPTLTIIDHPVADFGWMQRVQYAPQGGPDADDTSNFGYYNYADDGTFFAGDDCAVSLDFSVYEISGFDVILQIQAFNGSTFIAASQKTIPTSAGFHRYTHTYSNLPTNTTRVRLKVVFANYTHGDVVDLAFGAVNYEHDHPTAFISGDLGPGYSWSGTQYLSSSSRTTTSLEIDADVAHFDYTSDHTVLMWVKRDYDWDVGDAYPSLFGYGDYNTNNSIQLMFNHYSGTLQVYAKDNAGTWHGRNSMGNPASGTDDYEGNVWYLVGYQYDASENEVHLIWDGVLDEQTNTNTAWPSADNSNHKIAFGGRLGSTAPLSGALAGAAIFGTLLTAEEIAAIYALQRPLSDAGVANKPGVYLYDAWLLATSSDGSRVVLDPDDGIQAYSDESGNPQSVQIDVDGDVFLGSDISSVATTTLSVFSNAQTYDGESMGAGDILMGPKGTDLFNMLWDVSEGTMQLRRDETPFFEVNGADGLMKFGSNVFSASTTAIAIFGDDSTAYNSNTYDSGDILFGDDSANKANMFWDASTGTWSFRSGTTAQLRIATDGSLQGASGSRFKISDDGIKLARGSSAYNKVLWTDNSFSTVYGSIYTQLTGSTTQIVIHADAPSGQLGAVFLEAEDGTGTSVQATLDVANGWLVDGDIYATSGDLLCSGRVSTDDGATKWELGEYTSGTVYVDGYVTVTIDGTTYKLAAEAV